MTQVLVAGGLTDGAHSSNPALSDKAAVYDYTTDTWDAAQHVAFSTGGAWRAGAVSLQPYETSVVVTGLNRAADDTLTNEVWKFTPPSTWERLADLPRMTNTRASLAVYNLY